MIKFLINTALLFGIAATLNFSFIEKNTISQSQIQNQYSADSLESEIKISAVGDIMLHSTQYKYAQISGGKYDFNPIFRLVKNYLSKSDLLMGNLETVIAGDEKELSGYPVFNSPPQLLADLKSNGFNHLFLSNNHIFDMGLDGLTNTASLLDSLDISFSGISNDGREERFTTIYEIKGIRIAFLSYTYVLNRNSEIAKNYVNTINRKDIKTDIASAKNMEADLIIVYFHFGKEYARLPSESQRELAKYTVNCGADVILSSHTHTIQPVEKFKAPNSNVDSAVVIYSMGNFISNQRWRYSDCGLFFNLMVKKNFTTGSVSIAGINYLPFWIFKGETKLGYEYIIHPSGPDEMNHLPEYFSSDDSLKMVESYNDTKEILTRLGVNIKPDVVE